MSYINDITQGIYLMKLSKNSPDLISLIDHCEDNINKCHNDLRIIMELDNRGSIRVLNSLRLELSHKIDLYCVMLEQLRLYNS